eukprot:c29355_g1_i5 orf=974-2401(-)
MGGVGIRVQEKDESKRDRDDIIKDYERNLAEASRAAYVVAGLQSVTCFLGLCSLTWATVVLLGGFASTLVAWDFYAVTCLLLLDAGRYATAVFFSKIVTKKLIMQTQNPANLQFVDPQRLLADRMRNIAVIGQLLFVFPSFVLPIVRLKSGNYQRSAESTQPNLDVSLRIFYVIVLINAGITVGAILYSLLHRRSPDETIQRYYDEVLWRALDMGILEADNFEFFEFAFKLQCQDYSRNVQRKVVSEVCKNLIKYLYAHRKGVEVVGLRLQSSDAYEQQAAASIVGIWAQDDEIDPNKLPPSLLTVLADKLGTGQTGWEAAHSFSVLATRLDPQKFESISNSSGRKILDILIDLVDESTSSSLVFLRVFVELFGDGRGENIYNRLDFPQQDTLEGKLRRILRDSHRQRTKVSAGYALMEVKKITKEDINRIASINPKNDNYFYRKEVEMLNELRLACHLPPLEWEDLQGFEIRED